MGSAELWIIAGANGAGKSTIVSREDIRRELGDLKNLNPDVRAEQLRHDHPEMTENQANLAAVIDLEAELERSIEAGESILIETV